MSIGSALSSPAFAHYGWLGICVVGAVMPLLMLVQRISVFAISGWGRALRVWGAPRPPPAAHSAQALGQSRPNSESVLVAVPCSSRLHIGL